MRKNEIWSKKLNSDGTVFLDKNGEPEMELIFSEELPDIIEEEIKKIDLSNIDIETLKQEDLQLLADKIKPFLK